MQFRERELGAGGPQDAHYEKVRKLARSGPGHPIGVNCWGKLWGQQWRLAKRRSTGGSSCRRQRRGLTWWSVMSVGLRAGRRAVFPSIPWQRCQFHLAQNAQAHAHNRAQAREMGQAIRGLAEGHGGPGSPAVRNGEPPLGKVWRTTSGNFTVYRFPSQDPHRQPTGTGERSAAPGWSGSSPTSLGQRFTKW